jgi:hypothetical protein
MNWKLIIQLSLFGLAMGIATVFVIPSNVEPLFWLVIFVISAYFIATRCSNRYFLHGMLVSLANSVWITAAHFLLFDRYVANHPEEIAMMATMQLTVSPRLMMALMGPIFGVVSGVLLGVFAWLGSRVVEMRSKPSSPDQ